MQVYVMSFDSTAAMPENTYYIWYKGLYIKYNKTINNYTKKQDLSRTDSFLTITESGKKQDIWQTMSEFARAWAYANDIQIRTEPGIISSPACLENIKKHVNRFENFRTLTVQKGFMKGTEFLRIAHIDTEEKSKLLSIYTAADSNPDIYFKVLFFWHAIVYPSKNDYAAVKYINDTFYKLSDYLKDIKKVIYDGTFGEIKDNNIGAYIKAKVRAPITHIVKNSGINLDLDDMKQHRHLYAVANLLKEIAKYKLDNDYNFSQNAPLEVCRFFDPDKEFSKK